MNVNHPASVFLNNQEQPSFLISDSSLIHKLTDDSFYQVVRLHLLDSENDEGNYNYSSVSNIGMVYLFLHRRGVKRKANTKTEYARELLQFLRRIDDNGLSDIRNLKRRQIEAYQEWLAVSYPKTKTQAKKIAILSAFLSWCFEEGYLKRDLTRGLVGVKVDKKQIPEREISDTSLQTAIDYYSHDPKTRSLIMLLASTGLRLNEIVVPKWGDLYWDAGRKKHYLRTPTKRDGERHAHIKDYVLSELIEYRRRLGLYTTIDPNDDSPFYPNRNGRHYLLTSLSANVTKKLAAAALTTTKNQKATAHYFRHYFARQAFNNGAPTDRIAKTLGHSSSRITEENYLSRELKKEHDVSDYVDIENLWIT